MIRSAYFLLVAFVACACSNTTTDKPASAAGVITDIAKARIDSTLKAMVDSGRIAGVSALIFEHNREVYFNAFGLADREANRKMDRNTIVRIFSMTKPVTGVALMQLYEKGLFKLDDPVSKYIPEFADIKVFAGVDVSGNIVSEPPNRPVTIRDLTRHTTGFARDDHPQLGPVLKAADPMNRENTLAQMAERLAAVPLMAHPGEQWIYGPSVDVQALLVERLSGKAFDVYLKENIFDPLAMNTTGYVVAENDRDRFAALYFREKEKLNRVSRENADGFNTREWPLKPGGYGLTSTIDDYMRFARMLVNGGTLEGTTMLKPETVALMATNQLPDSVTERMWLPSKGRVGFGIDFAVRTAPAQGPDENVGTVGEFFWDGAASTLFWVDPVNKVTAVLFVQVFPFDRELHKRFRDAVYGPYQGPSL